LDIWVEIDRDLGPAEEKKVQQPGLHCGRELHKVIRSGHPVNFDLRYRKVSEMQNVKWLRRTINLSGRVVDHENREPAPRVVLREGARQHPGRRKIVPSDDGANRQC
jgi:hypothetical protein